MKYVFAILLGTWLQTATTGTVHLLLTERGSQALTAVRGTVYFEGPGIGRREQRVTSFAGPVQMTRLPPGTYRITMVAQSLNAVLVASAVAEVRVRAGEVRAVPMDLVQRQGWMVVVDSLGVPVPHAHYYTHPSSVNSSTDEHGRISLAAMAAGTELTVRTIQWGVTCHRVSRATRQTIVVPDATEEVVLVAPSVPTQGLPQRRHIVPALRLTGAVLEGLPGSDCPVPYEHLPVTLARAGRTTEHTLLLPFGEYVLRLRDGRTHPVSAPGRLVLR